MQSTPANKVNYHLKDEISELGARPAFVLSKRRSVPYLLALQVDATAAQEAKIMISRCVNTAASPLFVKNKGDDHPNVLKLVFN